MLISTPLLNKKKKQSKQASSGTIERGDYTLTSQVKATFNTVVRTQVCNPSLNECIVCVA